jgi:hypothetical protein
VQLEPADILGHSRIERPLEKRSKPPATADVAPLRSRTELALHFATSKLPVPDIELKSAKINVALIHRTILQKWQQLQDRLRT